MWVSRTTTGHIFFTFDFQMEKILGICIEVATDSTLVQVTILMHISQITPSISYVSNTNNCIGKKKHFMQFTWI